MTCDGNGAIIFIEINLDNVSWSGELDTSLGWPPSIEIINLQDNSLYGDITWDNFSNLTELSAVNLSNNNFEGNIEVRYFSTGEKIMLDFRENDFSDIDFTGWKSSMTVYLEESVYCDSDVYCNSTQTSITRDDSDNVCDDNDNCTMTCQCRNICDRNYQTNDTFKLCNIFQELTVESYYGNSDTSWFNLSHSNYCDWNLSDTTCYSIEIYCMNSNIYYVALDGCQLNGQLRTDCGDDCKFPRAIKKLILSSNNLYGEFDTSSLSNANDLYYFDISDSFVLFFVLCMYFVVLYLVILCLVLFWVFGW